MVVPLTKAYFRFAERLMPQNAALVLVDCQERVIEGGAARESLVNNLVGLARLACAHGLPTVLGARSEVTAGPVLADLVDLFGSSAVVRRRAGAFWEDPRSRSAVAATGRHDVILACGGPAFALAGSALAATAAGYSVHAVLDASGGGDAAGERVASARMSAAGVHLTTWVALLAELAAAGGETDAADAVRDNLARYVAGSAGWPRSLVDPADRAY